MRGRIAVVIAVVMVALAIDGATGWGALVLFYLRCADRGSGAALTGWATAFRYLLSADLKENHRGAGFKGTFDVWTTGTIAALARQPRF